MGSRGGVGGEGGGWGDLRSTKKIPPPPPPPTILSLSLAKYKKEKPTQFSLSLSVIIVLSRAVRVSLPTKVVNRMLL